MLCFRFTGTCIVRFVTKRHWRNWFASIWVPLAGSIGSKTSILFHLLCSLTLAEMAKITLALSVVNQASSMTHFTRNVEMCDAAKKVCVNKKLIWTSNTSLLLILWLLGMEFRQGRCIDTRVIFPTTTTTTVKTTFVDNNLETTEPEDTTTIPIPLESTPKGNSITPKGDSRVIVASVDQTTRFAFTVTTTTTSTTTQTTTTTTNAKPSTTISTANSPVTER